MFESGAGRCDRTWLHGMSGGQRACQPAPPTSLACFPVDAAPAPAPCPPSTLMVGGHSAEDHTDHAADRLARVLVLPLRQTAAAHSATVLVHLRSQDSAITSYLRNAS